MFNLKKYAMQKKAFYEGVQGYWVAQTRAWQNCIACKQKDGKSANDAWSICLKDYQTKESNLKWISDNIPGDHFTVEKIAVTLESKSYLPKIMAKCKSGKSIKESVLSTLEECKKEYSL